MATMTEQAVVPLVRKRASICVVGVDQAEAQLTSAGLRDLGFSVTEISGPEEALEKIRTDVCRIFVVDVAMPGIDGVSFLEQALRFDPGVYVILVSKEYQVEEAIEAIKRGAYDFLQSPLDFVRLERTLDEIVDVFSQRTQIRCLEESLFENSQFHGIVGKSPAILEVLDLAKKVARHYSNVLISGPTGSGKELVARAVHELSPVSRARFAVCNCSALVDTLLETQLFGHVRGSFTGAHDSRSGLFEFANNGTVFLDEIGETSASTQAKLLRVIQNREIQRIGSPEVKKINIRLIAATNRDLRTEVKAGRFREDLFYRLSSVEIRVPGLAERREDIPALVRHFLKKYSDAYGRTLRGLTRRAQIALTQHGWPGNVRELENVIASAAMTATADFIDLADLPEYLGRRRKRSALPDESGNPLSLREMRRVHVQRVLEICQGNRVRAAQMLGIGRTSLYRFLKRHGGSRSSRMAHSGAA
jgi:DNA-binding NtrC family response regulator